MAVCAVAGAERQVVFEGSVGLRDTLKIFFPNIVTARSKRTYAVRDAPSPLARRCGSPTLCLNAFCHEMPPCFRPAGLPSCELRARCRTDHRTQNLKPQVHRRTPL